MDGTSWQRICSAERQPLALSRPQSSPGRCQELGATGRRRGDASRGGGLRRGPSSGSTRRGSRYRPDRALRAGSL
eukprot:3071929-Prymnesium_polylepis.2